MLSIILGLLLATIIVGSRIQGWRKLTDNRVFFIFENIVTEVSSDYCNFVTVTYFCNFGYL